VTLRLVALEIGRFRGWHGPVRLELDCPVTAIVAENGRGKSSTVNALEWCLYGDAVIGKSSSGIEERQGWEIRPRNVGELPTEVRATFAAGDARIEVARCENPSGKKSERSRLELCLPDGTKLTDETAVRKMKELGVPDWDTFRIAHCFHQEAARRRVLDSNDRSMLLAAMLGLEEDIRVRDLLEGQRPSAMITAVDDLLGKLESHIDSVALRPAQELRGATDRLVARGLALTDLHAGAVQDVRVRLIDRARALAGKLGLTVELPSASDAEAVAVWAERWPETARRSAPALQPLESLRARLASLKTAASQAEQAARKWQEKKNDLEKSMRERGDRAARQAALVKAREDLQKGDDALAAANSRAAVLAKARDAIAHAHDTERCPVCDSRVADLALRVTEELSRLSGAEIKALHDAVEAAKAAVVKAEGALRDLDQSEAAVRHAETGRGTALEELSTLGGEEVARAHDPLAASRKRIEGLTAEISQLDVLATERDRDLSLHAEDVALLRDYERWMETLERAEKQVDVESLAAWRDFERAIDEAAGFASDLEALAGIARQLQIERSDARAEEVNRSLGRYFALIARDDSRGGVRVESRATRGKVEYRLLGDDDEPILPLLNQAALNALSLAVLFAQAEESSRRGGFACVLLDDPIQSLDEERQVGLAEALEELSRACPVLIAVVPGAFAERLRTHVSVKRRFVTLAPWDKARGASIAEEAVR
jgi:exonuclease SbcC